MATTPHADDLTTVKALLAYIGKVSTPDEVLAQKVVTAASQFFIEIIDRPIKPTAQKEVVSGRGQDRVFLPFHPVLSVESVACSGRSIGAATEGGTDSGYLLDDNVLILRGTSLERGVMNVVVRYTAGFATVPAMVEKAVLELGATWWKQRDTAGEASRSMGGSSVSFSKDEIPPSVKVLMDHMRRVVPA